jgi:phage recombination protein Bet
MTPQALVAVESAAPTITPEQLALVKKTIAKDATPDELQLYLYDCSRRGVHPLDRLLHFTKRSGKYTPITSIDFMRIRAAATKECAGIDDPLFTDGPTSPEFAAHITVYRFVQGQKCPFSATARWAEYKPDQDFMWRKMPHTMLGKCAEALALRKAFPQELAGLYESSELDQANGERVNVATGEIAEAPAAAPSGDAPITKPQQRRLFTIAGKSGWVTAQIKAMLHDKFGVDSTSQIPAKQYDDVVAFFESEKPPAPDPDQPFG